MNKTGVEYQEFFKKEIEKFNTIEGKDLDTRVIFLNGDYGWGKTTMIEKIADELGSVNFKIYSPWLAVRDKNMLVDLWSSVTGFDLRKTYRGIYVLSLVGTSLIILATLFSSSLANSKITLYCIVFVTILIVAIIFLLVECGTEKNKILKYISYKNNADQKFYGYYLEDIASRMPSYLVIEDVDRLNREELLELMKIVRHLSDVLKKENKKKTIILTGSAPRVILKSENSSLEAKNKGVTLIEGEDYSFATYNRVVQKTINFISLENNIEQFLTNKKGIEVDVEGLEFKLFVNMLTFYKMTMRDLSKMMSTETGNQNGELLMKFIDWYFSNKVVSSEGRFENIKGYSNNKDFLYTYGTSVWPDYTPIVEAELALISGNTYLDFTGGSFENIINYYCKLKVTYEMYKSITEEEYLQAMDYYASEPEHYKKMQDVDLLLGISNSSTIFPQDISSVLKNWNPNMRALAIAILRNDEELDELIHILDNRNENQNNYKEAQIAVHLAFTPENEVENMFPNLYKLVCCSEEYLSEKKKQKKLRREK